MNAVRKTTGYLALLLVLPLALLAIACSSDDDSSDDVGGAESELCSNLQELAASLRAVDGLNANSSVNDAQQAKDNVKKSWEAVKESAKDVANARTQALDDSYENFQDSVDDLSGSTTLGSAAQSLKTDAAGVVAARVNLAQSVNCPGTSTTPVSTPRP